MGIKITVMGTAGIDSQLRGEMTFIRDDGHCIIQNMYLIYSILISCRIITERIGGLCKRQTDYTCQAAKQ